MADNDIALRSQALSEQTGQRLSNTMAQRAELFQQMPNAVTGFQKSYAMSQQLAQQQQQHHAEMLQSASQLANDELRRKQAAEELQWVQQLHQTDMLGYQKRMLQAQTEFEEARLGKLKDDIAHPHIDENVFRPEHILGMRASGYEMTFEGGRFNPTRISPEEKAAARKEFDDYIGRYGESNDVHREAIAATREATAARSQSAQAATEARTAASKDSVAARREATEAGSKATAARAVVAALSAAKAELKAATDLADEPAMKAASGRVKQYEDRLRELGGVKEPLSEEQKFLNSIMGDDK